MAKKFYVVWAGRETGIFTDWDTCKRQIDGFAGARYKSYKTRAEAQAAYAGGAAAAIGKKAKAAPRKSAGKGLRTWTAAEVADLDVPTKIFTDGGCDPNPGPAGSGLAVYRENRLDELWYGLYNPQGTNNTAELSALHQALQMAEREIASGTSVAIFCDSQYAIQCVTKWAINWEKKGWTKQGGEIKNLDLIQPMFALHQRLRKSVQVLHVNGHVGLEGNELADRMSIHTIDTKEETLAQFPVPEDLKQVLAMRAG